MSEVHEATMEEQWEQWKIKYKKTYTCENEEQKRKIIWKESLKKVEEHRIGYEAGKYSYKISLTRFSDQSVSELSWMNGLKLPKLKQKDFLNLGAPAPNPNPNPGPGPDAAIENPKNFDWRDRGCVARVKDQDPFPACRIFAAVGAVESHHKITNGGDLIELSEQQLIDCMEDGDQPGDLDPAFKYIKENGLAKETDYAYSKKKEECKRNKEHIVGIEDWRKIRSGNEKELENVVANIGPVAVSLTCSDLHKFFAHTDYEDIFYDENFDKISDLIGNDEAFSAYKKTCDKEPLEHAALVVGYGIDKDKPAGKDKYWIVKNSWVVEDLGDRTSGYKKIAKDRGNNCNIAGRAMYPVGVHASSESCEIINTADELPQEKRPIATPTQDETSFTEETYLTWPKWKAKYNKTYEDEVEEEMRKKIWEESLKEIKEHNAKYYKGELTFRVNLTDLCDQKTEELWWLYGVADSSDESCDDEDDDGSGEDVSWDEDAGGGGNEDEPVSVEQDGRSSEHSSTPDNEMVFDTNAQKDWRVGNHVTPAKSQGRLPVCWIFAAVGAVESYLSITTGQLFELSVQQVVDCCEGGDKKGSLQKAFKYILKNGLMSDKLYPYEEKKRNCRVNKEQCHAKISKWKAVSPSGDEKELENVVQHIGPVAVTLTIYHGRSFQRLEKGIFKDDRWREVSSLNPSKERMRHCVLVVGFGTDREGNNYWLIKDSLHQSSGYKKLAKDADNMCDVAGAAVYPVKAAKPLRKRRSPLPQPS